MRGIASRPSARSIPSRTVTDAIFAALRGAAEAAQADLSSVRRSAWVLRLGLDLREKSSQHRKNRLGRVGCKRGP